MKKKGFTLIELLAVIIILAVIALIATPIILNVVDNAKESARQNSISGYADATRLAVTEYQFGHDGQTPTLDQAFIDTIKPQGSTVTCEDVIYSNDHGVVLNKCNVVPDTKEYCFASGKTYTDCTNQEFKDVYDKINGGIESKTNLISTLLTQYKDTNIVGLLKDGDNYYYKGTSEEVANNFVWYEGHLWRVIGINSDNTITMITQQPITAIQPAASVWTTQAAYESSYINTWLNNVFYKSISDKSKISLSTFKVGIYNNVSEITTSQYVGLLDETQYTRAGSESSFLNIYNYFWLGNRYDSSNIYNVKDNGNLIGGYLTYPNGVRPVITISDLAISSGNGSLSNSFREINKSTNTSNVKVGEYISVPSNTTYCNRATEPGRCLFRVVSKENDSVKVILNGLLPKTSPFGGASGEVVFKLNSTATPINTPLNNFANSISTIYRYLGTKSFNIGVYGNGANYTAVTSSTILNSIGLPVVGEMFSGNDIDVDLGEKFFVNKNTIENPSIASYFWTMNTYDSNNVRSMNYSGKLGNNVPTSTSNGVRPVLFLNLGTSSDLTFTKGDGTAETPFWLGN